MTAPVLPLTALQKRLDPQGASTHAVGIEQAEQADPGQHQRGTAHITLPRKRPGCDRRRAALQPGHLSSALHPVQKPPPMTPQLASVLMPLMRGMDPETRAWPGAARAALRPGRRRPLAGRPGAGDAGARARFPQPDRPGGRLRQIRGGAGAADAAGLRLRRGGVGHARPQIGNPKPRLFRLAEDRAVINRMGMNNAGLAAFLARLRALPRPLPAVLGVNIAINKDGAAPLRDYPALYAAVAPHADYVAINVSSPNTPGLRDLQGESQLREILAAVAEARAGRRARARRSWSRSRRTWRRRRRADRRGRRRPWHPGADRLQHHHRPPGAAALARIERRPAACPARRCAPPLDRPAAPRGAAGARPRLVLVGCGGVASGAEALEKIKAGAALVQLYAAFAYAGPGAGPAPQARARRRCCGARDLPVSPKPWRAR